MFFPKKRLPNWLDVVVSLKLIFVRDTTRGDLPPTIIAERKGRVIAIIISSPNNFNRDTGLHAAKIARVGMAADTITGIFDAHVRHITPKPDQNPEQVLEEYQKTHPYGSMQRECDEEGACERGEISDCLVVQRVNLSQEIMGAVLPYRYHGKGGAPFRWTEDDFQVQAPLIHNEEKTGYSMDGRITKGLSEIMAMPSFVSVFGSKVAKVSGADVNDKSLQFYHAARSAMRFLKESGFLVVDLITNQKKTTIDQICQKVHTLTEKELCLSSPDNGLKLV